ncbi:hypothetical protein VINI7043_27420 [Vibrio nigripulchritudo ATCC 27043]|nr:hypothetical protein VINI7043_27420 [Vibrio nigripulchritudo ATCC 27043]
MAGLFIEIRGQRGIEYHEILLLLTLLILPVQLNKLLLFFMNMQVFLPKLA